MFSGKIDDEFDAKIGDLKKVLINKLLKLTENYTSEGVKDYICLLYTSIAQDKMVDLNCFTVESAMKMVAGTARSMGIAVKGEFPVKMCIRDSVIRVRMKRMC